MSCSTTVCGTGGWNGPLPGDPDNSSVLTATSEYGGIKLTWTLPSVNAYAVAYTTVYRSTTANLVTATPIGTINGSSYFDPEPGQNLTVTYYYWIQHTSVNGTETGYVGPTSAKAYSEVTKILELLQGKVETSALAESLRSRIDIISSLEDGITSLNTRLETENGLITETLDAVKNDVSGATSYIQNQMELFADEKVALAAAVTTQVSEFSESVYAAVREETTTRAEETGALFAEKLVKIDLAGNVYGYGLSAYVDPDGTSMSEFRVAADRFSVGAPAIVQSTAPSSNNYNGKVWVDTSVTPNVTRWYNGTLSSWQTTPVKGSSPFIVKTSPETIDGVTIPAGVYIDNAFIDRIDANQINTRGLTIRDSTGKVLFGAGTALDKSNITGLGSLATQNSVSTSQVSGLGSLATQDSVSASQVSGLGSLATQNSVNWNTQLVNVPAFGNFAYLSSITSANIGTYIAGAAIGTAYISDAAITTAKIGNSQVDTLKIAGNSVFAATRGTMSGGALYPSAGSNSDVVGYIYPGITKNHSGSVIFIVTAVVYGASGGGDIWAKVYRSDGTFVGGDTAYASVMREWAFSYDWTFIDTSPVEGSGYKLNMGIGRGGSVQVIRADMVAISGKR